MVQLQYVMTNRIPNQQFELDFLDFLVMNCNFILSSNQKYEIIFDYLSLRELFEPARDDSFCASNNKFSLICILDAISRSAKELVPVDGGSTSIHGSIKTNLIRKKIIFFLFYLQFGAVLICSYFFLI